MLDLSTISEEVLLARGQYATVRAAHEDAKKELQMLCGVLSSCASQILRKMQPDNDDVPESAADLIAKARKTLDEMECCAEDIEALAKQRAELRKTAWAKS